MATSNAWTGWDLLHALQQLPETDLDRVVQLEGCDCRGPAGCLLTDDWENLIIGRAKVGLPSLRHGTRQIA